MYVKKTAKGIIFLILYVDDILLGENNMEMIQTTKQWLFSIFKMKNMGEVMHVLGVKIIKSRSKRLLI